jgi:GNAT superfamily N-acetyltransferase
MEFVWSDAVDDLDWQELSDLYVAAPLGYKAPAALKIAFSNSRYRCFVRLAGKIVGVGRVLADGADCAYICDMAILPSQQGTGLGRAILEHLMECARGHVKIILYAVPGKEGFYRKFGFLPMSTAMAVFADQPAAIKRGVVSEQ